MALLDDLNIGAVGDDPKKQLESIIKQVNENSRVLSNEDRTKIINDDSGTPRLLTGYQQDGFDNGNVGIKLSQEGYDVQSATGDQLIWSSDFNSFKIVQSGTAEIPAYSMTSGAFNGGSYVDVVHNLGFSPIVMAYTIDDSSNLVQLPAMKSVQYVNIGAAIAGLGTMLVPGVYVYAVSSDTHIRFQAISGNSEYGSGTENITATSIKYYLLRETAD
jgi:hypothetical protein